ncbi:PITH domain-containing protein [Halotydeus destructor]|nr:PITH domain-containing protein [Halotydeus destructor]
MAGQCHGQSDGILAEEGGDSNRGVEFSLYAKVDLDKVECLNELVDGSGKTIFKPWNERLSNEDFVESDADEELLIKVPFTGNVKLKGIIIRGLDDDSHPSRVRLFRNRPNMAFDDARDEADQEFELQKDPNGVAEYPMKIITFNNTHHLTLHFPLNFGEERTKIYYIGLKGDFLTSQRDAILLAQREIAPNFSTHKTGVSESMAHEIK